MLITLKGIGMNLGIIDAIRENDLERFAELIQSDQMSLQLCLNLALSFDSIDIIEYIEDELDDSHDNFQSETIYHNGLEYKTVLSKHTGKIWLDRNLGAKTLPDSEDDENGFGDYYQYSRLNDGHEKIHSDVIAKVCKDEDHSHGDFITSCKNHSYSWSKDCNDKHDWDTVVPKGFRLPTLKEIQSELISGQITDNNEAFESFLKLPSCGYRDYYDGVVKNKGTGGTLWTSSISAKDKLPAVLYYFGHSIGSYGSFKASGHNIRCIKI